MAKTPVKSTRPSDKAKKGSSPRKPLPRPEKHSSQRTAAPKPRRGLLASLTPERRMDLIGVVLALVGLLTLLSMISRQQGSLTDALVIALRQVAGWGTLALPLAFILVGVWIILRNIEKLPVPSTPSLMGVVLLYLNALAFLHLFANGGWDLARAGGGGGYIGAFIQQTLNGAVGRLGTVVALSAWLLVALALTFDVSIHDLSHFFAPLWHSLKHFLKKPPKSKKVTSLRSSGPLEIHSAPGELPSEFRLLNPLRQPDNASSAARPALDPQKSEKPAGGTSRPAQAETAAQTQASPSPVGPAWTLPVLSAILDPATPVAIQSNVDQDRKHVIEETLASFGAPAHVVDIQRGPTVTQFGVEPDFVDSRGGGKMRVRVSKIVSLTDDIALALAASRIRIQAPVPGRNYVGIEVPNAEISKVTLREVLESEAMQKLKFPLRFAIGKDVAGKSVGYDLASMPHLLIAGTTGSGKSVCVNSILCCFLINNSPNDLRLVLVDPKRVELTGYNGIPHLLAPVVVEAERVIGALQWMQREMDMRYKKFAGSGVRNIVEYNARNTNGDHLPYLVVVVDELADLMMLAPEETERAITRLAQLARATGIHLILATQRPSVDVVTGLIKANFPARIAFAVASGVDSRVILDQPGAERLLGRGDMLFQAPDSGSPVRLQGVYVSDSEIQRLVDYWRLAVSTTSYHITPESGPVDALPSGVPLRQTPLWDEMNMEEPGDPLFQQAVNMVRKEGKASITMLQRKLRIGYTRAARLVDAMEDKKIIGPPLTNSQVREVLQYGEDGPPKEE
ncbi:MAG TPA: DNA translocase FtsK 4TM domain-containing protein [Anaerolineaceae bacterium]